MAAFAETIATPQAVGGGFHYEVYEQAPEKLQTELQRWRGIASAIKGLGDDDRSDVRDALKCISKVGWMQCEPYQRIVAVFSKEEPEIVRAAAKVTLSGPDKLLRIVALVSTRADQSLNIA